MERRLSLCVSIFKNDLPLFDVSNNLVDQSEPDYDCTSHNNLTRSYIFYVVITHYSAGHKGKLASSWMQTMFFPKNIAKRHNLFQ